MSLVLRSRFNIASRDVIKSIINNSRRNYAKGKEVPEDTGKRLLKTVAKSAGLGFALGTAGLWYMQKYDSKETPSLLINEGQLEKSANFLESLPKVEFARQIQVPADKSGLEIVLFQYPTCPFCCKVRSFLDYYGISYSVVEVDPVLRQQIKWSEYKKVPILLVKCGEKYMQLNDSTMIVSCLESYLKSNKKISLEQIQDYYPSMQSPSDTKSRDIVNKYFIMNGGLDEANLEKDKEERKWRRWADEVLVHTLSPNVYRSTDEALQAFNWFSEVGEWDRLFPSWERTLIVYVGAYAMYFVGKKLKKKHQLKDNVRQSLYDECSTWTKEVDKRGKFFGGSKPNLADLSVYGVLSSIEGCQAFKELLVNTKIGTWYSEMKSTVQKHSGVDVLG